MSLLREWKKENTQVVKLGGEMKASDADKQIVEAAIEDLEVALGTFAEQVISNLDNSTIAAFSNPRYARRFGTTEYSRDSDTAEPGLVSDTDLVSKQVDLEYARRFADKYPAKPGYVPYVVKKDRNYHRVCIQHGGQRLFDHDTVRDRIRAIKILVHKTEVDRAADVFVDVVVMDLEAERAKHKGLSRKNANRLG